MLGATPLLLARSAKGDGHPVLVMPGLTAGDSSTTPLRMFLRRIGYDAHGWGMGTNRGVSQQRVRELRAKVDELAERHDRPVSLVGWSLGGVYAHRLAELTPSSVRSVITLGSPLGGGRRIEPRIPVTSVYSRSDPIVPWQISLVRAGANRENVEVRGSHVGLGHNPAVVVLIADRLAQPVGAWRPYQVPAWARRWTERSERAQRGA